MAAEDLWTYFDLELEVERLIGGIPKHPEIVMRWQEARWKDHAALLPDDPQTPEEAAELTLDALGAQALSEDEVKGIWTGFKEHPDGNIAVEGRQIKAMLKEAANVLRTMIHIHGKTVPLRARLAERVFVNPKLISLGIDKPTGTIERPIHVMTAKGQRTALKRTDYVDDAVINCELQVLADGMFTMPILTEILSYAGPNGLGTDRSQGEGVFNFTLIPRGEE